MSETTTIVIPDQIPDVPKAFGATTPADRIAVVIIMGLAAPLITAKGLSHGQVEALAGALVVVLNACWVVLNENKTHQSPIATILNWVHRSGQSILFNKEVAALVTEEQPALKAMAETEARKFAGGGLVGSMAAPVAAMIEVKAVQTAEKAFHA